MCSKLTNKVIKMTSPGSAMLFLLLTLNRSSSLMFYHGHGTCHSFVSIVELEQIFNHSRVKEECTGLPQTSKMVIFATLATG